jgi:AcrR family transcriptional regulator
MAVARTARESWIEQGLRALANGGPDAVRVEALARGLGVTKGGFYWHFDGRPALLEAMLSNWEQLVVDQAIEQAEFGGGGARSKLARLFALAGGLGSDLLKIELAVRDWARRDKVVARRLRRVDNRRMDYMRELFGEFCADPDVVEARCLLAFSLFIGSHFIAADNGPYRRKKALEVAAAQLLV